MDLVIVKVEVVSNAEPVSTLLTGKTFKMVNIGSSPHHHLKGRDHLRKDLGNYFKEFSSTFLQAAQ